MFLQGQISLPLSIYNIFTGSNQSPFIDLKCFYRVKSISLFSIYKVFTGSNQFLSSFCDVFTGSKQSPCIDLLEFYRFKSVSLFLFTVFLQGQMSLSFSIFKVLQDQISLPSSISKVFTWPKQCLDLHKVNWSEKTPWHKYMEVARSRLWASVAVMFVCPPLKTLDTK